MRDSSIPTVITLTANLLAEHCFVFGTSPILGRTQRATAESFQVGGKGLNVAKMLHRLGTPTLALAAVGGPRGATCRTWLEQQPWPSECFPTRTPTRLGLVVRGPLGPEGEPVEPETSFLGPDQPLCAEAFAALAAHVRATPDSTLIALCGSVPGWSSPAAAPLREALARRAESGTLVVDTYGPPLVDLARCPALLIKINADEFSALSGASPGPDSLRSFVQHSPTTTWIVSDGPRVVYLAAPGRPVRSFQPPRVREVSATGCGDVLLAALLHARLIRSADWEEALAFALPLAAANASHPGVGEFDIPATEPPPDQNTP